MMMVTGTRNETLALLAAAVVLAWAPPSSVALAAPVALDADPSASRILVVTRRSGLFGFMGHEHAVLARKWSSVLCMDREQPERSRVKLVVESASLVADEPEARKEAGLESGGPGPDDVAKIQAKMLGPDVLLVAKYPEIRFESRSVHKQPGSLYEVTGAFSLHGVTRELTLPVIYAPDDKGRATFSSDFKIKQSDYGIDPVSVGGVVNVKDEVEIRVRVAATFRSGENAAKPALCGPAGPPSPAPYVPGRSQATQR